MSHSYFKLLCKLKVTVCSCAHHFSFSSRGHIQNCNFAENAVSNDMLDTRFEFLNSSVAMIQGFGDVMPFQMMNSCRYFKGM